MKLPAVAIASDFASGIANGLWPVVGNRARRDETHGPDPGEEAVSTYLWSRGLKQIDVVALTHAHQYHIGGLTDTSK